MKNIKDLIPKDLFDILACPICKSELNYNKDKTELICVRCKKRYPIKQGVPVLLP